MKPCPGCGKPMKLKPKLNKDGKKLWDMYVCDNKSKCLVAEVGMEIWITGGRK